MKTLTLIALASAVLLNGFSALAHPTDLEDSPVYEVQAGSTFTLREDVYISRGETATALNASSTDVFSRCFLQAYYPKQNDRVVRAGRTLTLKSVTVAWNFMTLNMDDGRGNGDHVIAQIGCNLRTNGQVPIVSEARSALEATFDMDLQGTPIEEVNLPIGSPNDNTPNEEPNEIPGEE